MRKRTGIVLGLTQLLLWQNGCSTNETEPDDGAQGGEREPGSGGKSAAGGKGTGGEDGLGGTNLGGSSGDAGGSRTGVGGSGSGGEQEAGSGGASGGQGPLDAIWYFVRTTGSARLVNVLSSEGDVDVLSGAFPEEGLVPWSSDGKSAAQVEGGKLRFYQLGERAEVEAEVEAPDYVSVDAWVEGVGPVVSGGRAGAPLVTIVQPNGGEIVLLGGDTMMSPYRALPSPSGRDVVWTVHDGTSFNLWHLSLSPEGIPSEPTMFAAYTGSPALSQVWSRDGQWLAYGVSSGDLQEAGIYLYRAGADTATRVSPDGGNYNPYFSFSEDSSLVVMLNGADSTTGLYALSLDELGLEREPLVAQALVLDAMVSPAVWNGFGALQYTLGDEGRYLVPNLASSEQSPLDFEAYRYDCEMAWTSASRFLQAACALGGPLVAGQVDGDVITTSEVEPDGLPHLQLDAARRCLLTWSSSELRVGDAVSSETVLVPTDGVLQTAEFTPDGRFIVFSADGATLSRIAVSDCAPQGSVIKVRDLDGPIDSATFLARPR